MKFFFLLLILLSLALSNNKEQLFYSVYYNGVNAGSAFLEFNDIEDDFANIKFDLKSKKIIDFVYKLREETSLIVDKIDYSIKEIRKKSRQGRKRKNFSALFNYNDNEGYINNKKIDIDKSIYDPISIIYHLRNEKINLDKNFTYNIISKNQIKPIEMKVLGEEQLIKNNKVYDCYILGPNNLDRKGSKLVNIDEIKIWFNKDSTQHPLVIEKKAKFGVIKMELESIQIVNE